MERLRLLALSGSLRQYSYNTAALHALKLLAPADIDIVIGSIATLPLFNPDRENEHVAAVAELKASLQLADGLIIASPEYAHGVSGPMKNALDWLVSGEEFPYIAIMLVNTSPRAHHAQDALREILMTMSGNIVEAASLAIPLLGSQLDPEGILANEEISDVMRRGLSRFSEYISLNRAGK